MSRRDLPPNLRARRARKVTSPPVPRFCGRLLVRLAPRDVGMFRFLLEAYGHVAAFTVLEPKTALLKVFFSPHMEDAARRALAEIGGSLDLEIREWPERKAGAPGGGTP